MNKKNKTSANPLQTRAHHGFFKSFLEEVREEIQQMASVGICIALAAGLAFVVNLFANEPGAAHGLFGFTATVFVGAIIFLLLTQKSSYGGKALLAVYHKVRKVRDPAARAKMVVKSPSTLTLTKFCLGGLVALACLACSDVLSGFVMDGVRGYLGGDSVMYSLLDFLRRNLMGLGLALFLINRVDFLADWLVAVNKETAITKQAS
jgi:hypothetical protein